MSELSSIKENWYILLFIRFLDRLFAFFFGAGGESGGLAGWWSTQFLRKVPLPEMGEVRLPILFCGTARRAT